jgi:multiple sugar transport system ATP-binding protein
MATLSLHNIQKDYAGTPVIKDLTLEVADREFIVFVGPSGCGKSTLIRMIAGLEEISGGSLLIDGKRVNDVGPADRGLAMVFQSYALYPHMNVRENMSFALRLAGVSRAERDRKVTAAASALQLEPYLDYKPGQLSGGQRQRVAIGRAIVRNPKIFLFDEPLSNLDASLRGQMRVELARLHAELKATMVYVTHDQVEAMTMADRIVVLRAGRIEQVGTPLDIYHHPCNLFVARFIGSPQMNLLPARVVGFNGNEATVEIPGGAQLVIELNPNSVRLNEGVQVGVRPEGLRPHPEGNLAGVIRLVERLGALSLVHIDIGPNIRVIAQMGGSDPVAPRQRILLKIDGACCHVFDANDRALPKSEARTGRATPS